MKNPARDAPRVMIWSMIWAGVTAVVTGAIMCYTVGGNWSSRLDETSPYLSWFMDVTGSVYGGGVFCAVIMMGLNVGHPASPFRSQVALLCLPPSHLRRSIEHKRRYRTFGCLQIGIDLGATVSYYPQPVHGKCSHDLEDGDAECSPLLRLLQPYLTSLEHSGPRPARLHGVYHDSGLARTRLTARLLCHTFRRWHLYPNLLHHTNPMRRTEGPLQHPAGWPTAVQPR